MQRIVLAAIIGWFCTAATSSAAEPGTPATYDLTAHHQAGDRCDVVASFQFGGDMLIPAESGPPVKLPQSVVAEFAYQEQLLQWSVDAGKPLRSLRKYSRAQATQKTDQQGVERNLPADRRLVVAELGEAGLALRSLAGPLTRDQFDLLDAPAPTLAIDRLLPNRQVQQGDHWDHDAAAIAPLLGMDHVAVCEVRSVVTGEENRQVKVRLAGAVQGTVEGATTEMTLRAAYLYHLDQRRITKLNLAIEEKREPGQTTPGLDVVAKLSLTLSRSAEEKSPFVDQTVARAEKMPSAQLRELLVDSPERGYRLRHDSAWFVTAEERELMALRLVQGGDLLAHCNITTLPGRRDFKQLDLKEFEADVVKTLGDKLDKVEAATEWTTAAGAKCLGVIARGAVDEVPIEWRYYRLSAQDAPQITVAVTVTQAALIQFADADKPLIESLEPLPLSTSKPAPPGPEPTPATASRAALRK